MLRITLWKKPLIKALSLSLVALVLASCSGEGPNRKLKTTPKESVQSKIENDEPVDFELAPTYQPPVYKPKKKPVKTTDTEVVEPEEPAIEKQYEKRAAHIENKQAKIKLDSVNMGKVSMKYDSLRRHLTITGQADILDDSKKPVANTKFTLVGLHSLVDMSLILKPETVEKVSSSEQPVVRAKVTCLAKGDNDQTQCTSVIIDFLFAYKKEFYTDQMEVKRTVLVASDKKDDEQAEVSDEDDDGPTLGEMALQKEGEDESALGRFVGQAANADLKEIFSTDTDIQSVIKPGTEDDEKEDAVPQDKIIDDDNKVIPIKPVTPIKTKKSDDSTVVTTPDIKQTKAGDLRPVNQAIGKPDRGMLRNATSLIVKQVTLDKNAFYEIVHPSRQRFYGTYEMAEMITRLGARLHQQMEKKIAVSDISKVSGGKVGSHLSHQIGLDADMGYPTEDNTKFPVVVQMSSRSYAKNAYSVEKTYDLFKFAFKQPDIKVERIFTDRLIKQALCAYAKAKGEFQGKDKVIVTNLFKSMDHVSGHGDHFHIRLKCSPADPACQEKAYLANNGCD